MPHELPPTVRRSVGGATSCVRPRASYVSVAQATRLMVERLAALDLGRPAVGAAGDRELRVALVLIHELTTWCRLDDRLARRHLARLADRSEDTVARALSTLSGASVVRYRAGQGQRLSTVGLPLPGPDAGNASPPNGEPVGLAAVSEATRALIRRALRADLTPSALLLVAVLVAELTTWTRLEGDVALADLMKRYGFSRSALRRACHALRDAGLISFTPGRGRQPTHVVIVVDDNLDLSRPDPATPVATVPAPKPTPAPIAVPPGGLEPTPRLDRYVDALRRRVSRWGGPAQVGFLAELLGLRPGSKLWPLLADADAAGVDPDDLAFRLLDALPAEARSSWVGLLIARLPAVLAESKAAPPTPSGRGALAPVVAAVGQPTQAWALDVRIPYERPPRLQTPDGPLEELAERLRRRSPAEANLVGGRRPVRLAQAAT